LPENDPSVIIPESKVVQQILDPPPTEQPNAQAFFLASKIPFLSPEALLSTPSSLPTHAQMEEVLLNLRKKSLMQEYFGDQQPKEMIVT
jgi:hypothetical protein